MPRRSFQLTPEQAKLPEPKHGCIDRFAERLLPGVPALKAATIAVALLFISVTAFDVLTDQSAHDSMGPSAIQREADLPAPAAEAPQTAATELPVLQDTAGGAPPAETDSDGLLEESAPTGGAENASAPSTEAASGAAPEAASESESADESFESSAMQEAPAAPATTLELAPASPTAEPTAAATSAPEPPATSTPTATPVPDSSDGKGGFSLSWWRIAELSLLMVLIWLIVTWIGRRGVGSLDE
ncbi:MAG: hypothetical protein E6R14_07735 [Thermomicrobiales bacterium]|nr:MAG: hypothetical protein E6R14_07735 [Thermomicrobiales bacterium]